MDLTLLWQFVHMKEALKGLLTYKRCQRFVSHSILDFTEIFISCGRMFVKELDMANKADCRAYYLSARGILSQHGAFANILYSRRIA